MSKLNNLLVQILILASIIILFSFFKKINKNEAVYVKSDLNNKKYFVQNNDEKYNCAYILSIIDIKITTLKKYLSENIDKYPDFAIYIKQFCSRVNRLVLYENKSGSKYTSYTINKGEEMVLCLRSKTTGNLHDVNLITYVVLHELSHIACPELNHTNLFKRIFKFFIEIVVKINIYKNINYAEEPMEYCGMTINENLVKN